MLDLLPLAMTLSQNAVNHEFRSALPNAPVVPDRPARTSRPRAVRTRTGLAHLLERTAQWVAPAPQCTPVR